MKIKEFEEFEKLIQDYGDKIYSWYPKRYDLESIEPIKDWISQNFTANSLIKEKVEEMKKNNRNSIDKIPEKEERDRITNLLNENMIFGYQSALQDLLVELVEICQSCHVRHHKPRSKKR